MSNMYNTIIVSIISLIGLIYVCMKNLELRKGNLEEAKKHIQEKLALISVQNKLIEEKLELLEDLALEREVSNKFEEIANITVDIAFDILEENEQLKRINNMLHGKKYNAHNEKTEGSKENE